MSRNPQQPNLFRRQDVRDPFGSPTPSIVHAGQPSESDMDHNYDRRDTFQSEASGVGNAHDYDQPFDPYGKLPAIFLCPFLAGTHPPFPSKVSATATLTQSRSWTFTASATLPRQSRSIQACACPISQSLPLTMATEALGSPIQHGLQSVRSLSPKSSSMARALSRLR